MKYTLNLEIPVEVEFTAELEEFFTPIGKRAEILISDENYNADQVLAEVNKVIYNQNNFVQKQLLEYTKSLKLLDAEDQAEIKYEKREK